MKYVLLAVAALAVGGVSPTPVVAQELSEWGVWDGPRRMRQRPPAIVRPTLDDDEDDDDFEERQYRARRDDDRRFDNRGYDEDAAFERRYQREDRRRFNRRYEQRDEVDDDTFEEERDTGPRAGRPSGGNVGADGKVIGANGGARPVIQPATPPVVAFSARYPQGSIVIDTSARKLYYVRGNMSAFAYPIGVGRDGFSWSGTEKVSRVADWPDWYPPAEMRKRKPELPERMLGGLNNPLGAKAIYLGNTLYRIHGTNEPKSIGRAESSGCFRMLNAHVLHLASLVQVGAEVSVVRGLGAAKVAVAKPAVIKPKPQYVQQQTSRERVQWSADPNPVPYEAGEYAPR